MIKLPVALALLCLAACNSTSPGDILAKSRFDPRTADFEEFAARVEFPAGIVIPENGAQIELGAQREDGEQLSTVATMEQNPNSSGRNRSANQTFFTLAPTEIAKLDHLGDQIRAWEADGHRVQGFFTVRVAGCRNGVLENGPLPMTIWLKLRDEDGYQPFQRAMDLRDVKLDAGLPVELGACANF